MKSWQFDRISPSIHHRLLVTKIVSSRTHVGPHWCDVGLANPSLGELSTILDSLWQFLGVPFKRSSICQDFAHSIAPLPSCEKDCSYPGKRRSFATTSVGKCQMMNDSESISVRTGDWPEVTQSYRFIKPHQYYPIHIMVLILHISWQNESLHSLSWYYFIHGTTAPRNCTVHGAPESGRVPVLTVDHWHGNSNQHTKHHQVPSWTSWLSIMN